VNSHTTRQFRKALAQLPKYARQQAREAYKLFEHDPYHPGLNFKQVHPTRPFYSVRVTLNYRAIGVRAGDNIIWFWIGPHDEYDKLLKQL